LELLENRVYNKPTGCIATGALAPGPDHQLTIVYPNNPSVLRLVEHGDSLPNPKSPKQWTLLEEATSTFAEDELGTSCSNVDPDFPERTVRHLI
jgi:hypothetical protein